MILLYPVPREDSPDEGLALAVATAGALKAEVRGLFVVDTEGIRRSEAGAPPGAIHIARQAEERIAEREAESGRKALARLGGVFTQAGIRFAGEVLAGDPEEELGKEAASCDLLVTGIRARFRYRDEGPSRLPLSLMQESLIPVFLASPDSRPVRTVVVGCGGGRRSARAVGAMAKLGLFKEGVRVVLAAVDDSPEAGEARLGEPRRILAEAGYPPPDERVVPGPKLDGFTAFCENERADAVVLGGWGEHRWNEYLGGSITELLFEAGRYHLFLYM
jgi:nucleotide-binding universal stress UspA family protein